ncbi:MAG: phosphoribosylanthranilate isomerase [Pirellulaceae bacterium]
MANRLPRIKVCGVTRLGDLGMLAEAGVDAVGINLVPSSPRCVDASLARKLSTRANELGLTRVAVVMNPTIESLRILLSCNQYDFIQLHGVERPELLVEAAEGTGPVEKLPGIIKALSWSGREEERELARHWQQYRVRGMFPLLSALLIDAYAPAQGGGTGRIARWDLIFPRPIELEHVPLILAGGLTAANVESAIAATHPLGVDTASGVEESPGLKSVVECRQFASNATAALRGT